MQIDEGVEPVHDFGKKLRQPALLQHLKNLVTWAQQAALKNKEVVVPPNVPVISVNLDLTTACNHACRHCVDDGIINSGRKLDFDDVVKTIDTLSNDNLRSVILIGGGEPTLHHQFAQIVDYIKKKGLQLGVVSHGGFGERIEAVADLFTAGDWVRFSIDAATNETYQQIHWLQSGRKPANTLQKVLNNGRRIIDKNPLINLGYSFVIVWDGLEYHDRKLLDNIYEIPGAVRNAREYGFSYVSLKPCLIKYENEGETLLYKTSKEYMARVVERINKSIQTARGEANKVRILLSQNLVAMLQNNLDALRQQPDICYAGFIKQVVSPYGIFHCPAYRGDSRAKVGDNKGYTNCEMLKITKESTTKNLLNFHAAKTCGNIACFYNGVNRYIRSLVDDKIDIDALQEFDGNDFFF